MDVETALRTRRSIRAFRSGEVPSDAVEAMKEAVRGAPSAGHLQSRRFCFVTRPAARQALAAACYQPDIFEHVPLVVVACTDDERVRSKYGDLGVELFTVEDVAAAVQCLCLQVHALGLGTVWIGAFRPEAVTAALELPPHLRPLVLLPIGHPAEAPEAPARLPDDQLFVDVS